MSSVFLRLRSKRYFMRAAARLRLPRETKLYRQSNVFLLWMLEFHSNCAIINKILLIYANIRRAESSSIYKTMRVRDAL